MKNEKVKIKNILKEREEYLSAYRFYMDNKKDNEKDLADIISKLNIFDKILDILEVDYENR